MANKTPKKPFFASFLEKQVEDPEKIKGGSGTVTSALQDNSTAPLQDSPTKPTLDTAQTMKYPSDGDEGGNDI